VRIKKVAPGCTYLPGGVRFSERDFLSASDMLLKVRSTSAREMVSPFSMSAPSAGTGTPFTAVPLLASRSYIFHSFLSFLMSEAWLLDTVG
jgi:hypothetical protein